MSAPAGIRSQLTSSDPGRRPRERMSSLKEVSSTDLRMRGSLTNVPEP